MYSVVLMMALSSGVDAPALGRRHGCDGCYGGCYGGYSGCYGSACNGGCHHRERRHRCHGCYSGCHGYASCCGTYYTGCYGGCYGGYPGCYGAPPAPPAKMPPGGKTPEPVKSPAKTGSAMLFAPATIVVSLPADAKLMVDGAPTVSTASTRVFASPALEPGKEYFYNLEAQLVRDGRTLTASKQVAVHAGEETRIALEFPVATLAQR